MDYIQVSLAEAIPEQARDYASARIGSLDRYAPDRDPAVGSIVVP